MSKVRWCKSFNGDLMKMQLCSVLSVLIIAFTVTAVDKPKFVLLETVNEDDADANGTVDTLGVVSDSYDDEGRVVFRVAEWDFDGNGIMDHRSTSSITYNEQGQRLRAVNESYDLPSGML